MSTPGFDKYRRFYAAEPAIVLEWHDDQSTARGWLAIDSLRGDAAGGGTRMRVGGSRQEAVFLAKTMGVKFGVAGPAIGGAKSVIDFDADSPPHVKAAVLRRWYKHIAPFLRQCYGTGGDVGVDEVSEATAYIREIVGNTHPQEGIARGHDAYRADAEGPTPKVQRLKLGVEAPVHLDDLPGPRDGHWMVADVATGFGVVKSIERFAHRRGINLRGTSAIIEGFGAVGAFAAYYLSRLGVKVIAASSRNADRSIRVAANPAGLDVLDLIRARDGTSLPHPSAQRPFVSDAAGPEGIFQHKADIFIPAAASHTITLQRAEILASLGVKIIACGANNPFHAQHSKPSLADWVDDMLAVQRVADPRFAIIPDFIANAGMARTFAYLMDKGGKTDQRDILADIEQRLFAAVDQLLDRHDADANLLDHAYQLFVPDRAQAPR